MGFDERLYPIFSNPRYTYIFFTLIAFVPRIVAWASIPVDWNSDSYHHWQIAYMTLKIGLPKGRLWDLNGCEYYWGVIPHLVQALLLGVMSTTSILPYRILNIFLAGANTYLIYIIGRDNYYWRIGLSAALIYALYPVAVIFDIVALQEPLALFFALLSLALFNTRPGWSGLFLALAAQSRTEYWLVSPLFVAGAVAIERASQRVQAFALSWLIAMSLFCFLFRHWTSNAAYPLYWSLFSVFGGWTQRGLGLPLPRLMMMWLGDKLRAWPGKATGQLLLGSAVALSGSFVHMVRSQWRRYHLFLFFLISAVVFGPIFVTYFPGDPKHLLYMLRMSLPLAAVGSVFLAYFIYKVELRLSRKYARRIPLTLVVVLLELISMNALLPAYGAFQGETLNLFDVADAASSYYVNGTIVCDHPTANYRLISRWGVSPEDLLSNHYAPHYYGVTDPARYAEWFAKHNVTLWLHCGSRSRPVWAVVSREYPDLLQFKEEVNGIRIYVVNQTRLERIIIE